MDAQAQLDSFIDRFTPAVAADARYALGWLTARVSDANLLVYDNYNALAIAFSANEKLRGVVMSIALYPRWVSLFLARGTLLSDPAGLLEGTGRGLRHVKLRDRALFDDPVLGPALGALVDGTLALADPPIDPAVAGRLIIKSISPKQRPRQP